MSIVLQFKYAGGSHPGTVRTVYDKSRSVMPRVGLVEGIDLDLGTFRKFDVAKMRDVKHVQAVELELDKLPKSIPATSVVNGYKAEGKLVHYDNERNVVLVLDKPGPSGTPINFNYAGFGNPSFYIDGRHGTIRLAYYSSAKKVVFTAGGITKDCNAETLLTYLKRIING